MFNIAIFVRDQEYANVIENCFENFMHKYPKASIDVISEKNIKTINNNIVLKDLILDQQMPTKSEYFRMIDHKIWLNKSIFEASPRNVFSNKNLTLNDQIAMTLKIKKIFSEKTYNLVLAGGAAYLIWTIPILLSLEQGIPAYKLQTFNYINPNYEGVRIWFCSDPFWNLNVGNQNDFSWDKKESINHIEQFRNSITTGKYDLAVDAYKIRSDFTPNNLYGLIKNILKYLLSSDNVAELRLKSFLNSFTNKRYYMNFRNFEKKYFLFPLNQPYDEQLLFRSPEFKNNFETINLIAKNLPKNTELIVKEHPVNPGMISTREIKKIKAKFNNVHFVNPNLNLYSLISKCLGLITVNSTSGLEALIHKKNILVLGRGYYRDIEGVFKYENEQQLKQDLIYIKDNQEGFHNNKDLDIVLQKIINQTFPRPNHFPDKKTEHYNTLTEALEFKVKQLYESSIKKSL